MSIKKIIRKYNIVYYYALMAKCYLEKIKFKFSTDKKFLSEKFKRYHGYYPNLTTPKTFNEKVLYRILNDSDERFSTYSDKYLVRNYINDKVGSEYLIPIIATYSNTESIDFENLPQKFVLKGNHDSGSVIICKDKEKLNLNRVRHKLNISIKTNFYHKTREKHYNNIKPLIICEELLEPKNNEKLIDYKFHIFKNKELYIQIVSTINGVKHRTFLDKDWNILDLQYGGSPRAQHINKPYNLEIMKEIAFNLSFGFSYVRVDLYEMGNKVYFGEMTFTPGSGMETFSPISWDHFFGELWN